MSRTVAVWDRLNEAAVAGAQPLIAEVEAKHSEWLERERDTARPNFAGRRELASRVGLSSVREHRMDRIDVEERQSNLSLARAQQLATDVHALLLVHVEPLDQ